MNKEQIDLLLKEKEELKGKKKNQFITMIIGLGLIISSAFTPGISLGIIGFIGIVLGGSKIDKIDKRSKEIDFNLAGTKIKKQHKEPYEEIKEKYICGICNSKVNYHDLKCKKCKNILKRDGAIKKVKRSEYDQQRLIKVGELWAKKKTHKEIAKELNINEKTVEKDIEKIKELYQKINSKDN